MKNGRQHWIYSTSRQEGVLVKKTYKCAEYCESKEKKCDGNFIYHKDRCMREFTLKNDVKVILLLAYTSSISLVWLALI